MTQLEYEIAELEKKQKEQGLTTDEERKLQELQDVWYKVESAQYGQCLNCFI